MRILIVSDTHGSTYNVEKAIEKLSPDRLIFLGDGEKEMDNLSLVYDKIPFDMVSGNCDYMSQLKTTDIIEVRGKRIMFTHGHLYDVRTGTEKLEAAARNSGCDIVLYGHTHCAENRYSDGLYVINPGSPSCPYSGKASVAYIDLINDNILTNIVEL